MDDEILHGDPRPSQNHMHVIRQDRACPHRAIGLFQVFGEPPANSPRLNTAYLYGRPDEGRLWCQPLDPIVLHIRK